VAGKSEGLAKFQEILREQDESCGAGTLACGAETPLGPRPEESGRRSQEWLRHRQRKILKEMRGWK
jgi:hypothetical protein